jgi:hypothetical protein
MTASMAAKNGQMQRSRPPAEEDNDSSIQGLTNAEIRMLAQKVYDLLLDELRIEAERHGRGTLR